MTSIRRSCTLRVNNGSMELKPKRVKRSLCSTTPLRGAQAAIKVIVESVKSFNSLGRVSFTPEPIALTICATG